MAIFFLSQIITYSKYEDYYVSSLKSDGKED